MSRLGPRFFALLFAGAILAVGTLAIGSDTSAFMGMEIPAPGDAGPQWATDVQEALELIDAHDHTAGKGTKVPTAGYDENADHEMNANDLTEARSVRFDSANLTIAVTDRRAVYVSNGNLWYVDESGNTAQITDDGDIYGTPGSITGMDGTDAAVTYSDVTKTFSFTRSSGFPANGDFSSVRIAEEVANGKGPVLQSNAATAADFDFFFPAALPGANRLLCLDASGNLSTCTASAAAEALVIATSTSSGTVSATTTVVAGTEVVAGTTVTGVGGIGLASEAGGTTKRADGSSNSTTTPSDIGGVQFDLVANGQGYFIDCAFTVEADADTTGVQIGLDFDAAPGQVAADCGAWDSTSVWTYTSLTADDGRCVMVSNVNGNSRYEISGFFETGVSTTSVVPRLRSEVGGSLVTVHAGLCTVVPVNL